ncbi:hypothetical protein SRHO_G00141990 [Serrasalmus rhombeus]
MGKDQCNTHKNRTQCVTRTECVDQKENSEMAWEKLPSREFEDPSLQESAHVSSLRRLREPHQAQMNLRLRFSTSSTFRVSAFMAASVSSARSCRDSIWTSSVLARLSASSCRVHGRAAPAGRSEWR